MRGKESRGRRPPPSSGQRWKLTEPPRRKTTEESHEATFDAASPNAQTDIPYKDNPCQKEQVNRTHSTTQPGDTQVITEKLIKHGGTLMQTVGGSLDYSSATLNALVQWTQADNNRVSSGFKRHSGGLSLMWADQSTVVNAAANHIGDWLVANSNMMSKSQNSLFLMICWYIWFARNEQIWNNVTHTPRAIVERAKAHLAEWPEADDDIMACIAIKLRAGGVASGAGGRSACQSLTSEELGAGSAVGALGERESVARDSVRVEVG
nr:pentatricopeptide repeat-containing protein [Ipomoea batatas]